MRNSHSFLDKLLQRGTCNEAALGSTLARKSHHFPRIGQRSDCLIHCIVPIHQVGTRYNQHGIAAGFHLSGIDIQCPHQGLQPHCIIVLLYF